MRIILKGIILISLCFSITNYVPLSLSVILLLPLSVISVFYRSEIYKIKKIELYLVLLYLYIIVSVLVYNPSSFLDLDFYRRDGNFIVSYLVLFVFIFLPISISIDFSRTFDILFPFFVIVSCIAYIAVPKEITDDGSGSAMHFLFISHNAAGGFYSILAAVALGMLIQTKNKIYFLYSGLFLFFLYSTNSRGSIIAIGAAIAYSIIKFKRPALVFFAFLIIQFIIVYETYPVWVTMGKIMSEQANFTLGNVSSDIDFNRAGTFIDRLYYLWPRAIDNFIHSPLFGMGFGSFDDLYYKYINIINHVVAVKDGGIIRHSDAHAHNSTFTILAELGIVGYSLFILLFNEINKRIHELSSKDPIQYTCLSLALWTCIFSSATEHRITTPAQMVPFFIIFGISYIQHFGRKRRHV
ncbi:O-antigen ligase family protein [Raoultella ornithinolytica]|uniref:O-antigen ligase family protein n=1 Tax=Raoultella ornithinolytica TaxID=54291 RepID=UPI0040350FEE